MIETLEGFRAALLLAANLCTAMWAGVQYRFEISLAVAGEQDASAPDLTGHEIAGLGELRTVAEVEPAFIEYLGPFGIQNDRIDKGLTRDFKDLLRFIDQKRCLHRPNCIHWSASLDQLVLSACRRSYAVDSISDRLSFDCLATSRRSMAISFAALIEIAPTISLPRMAATENRSLWQSPRTTWSALSMSPTT